MSNPWCFLFPVGFTGCCKLIKQCSCAASGYGLSEIWCKEENSRRALGRSKENVSFCGGKGHHHGCCINDGCTSCRSQISGGRTKHGFKVARKREANQSASKKARYANVRCLFTAFICSGERRCTFHGGKKSAYHDVEGDLRKWVLEKRQKRVLVTKRMVIAKVCVFFDPDFGTQP